MVNEFANMVGVTMVKVTGHEQGSESMTFYSDDGRSFTFYHSQDCCESVYVEDVCGDVEDLIGSPFLLAAKKAYDKRKLAANKISQ